MVDQAPPLEPSDRTAAARFKAAPPPDEIARLAEAIRSAIVARAPDALRDFPTARYLHFFDLLPDSAPYHAVPPRAQAFASAIEQAGGPAAVEDYNRLATLELIARDSPADPMRLTPTAQDMRRDYLAQVLSSLAAPRKGYFRHGNAMFAKDFAVCRGRLLPCGVELIDPRGGIPRRLFARGGPVQALAMLRLGTRAGGWSSFWGLHFDRRLIGEFDAAGYARLYLRLADLLAFNPQVRGVTSASWWHDPHLAQISPELSFIDDHPLSAGATLLRVGEDAVATADATRFAPARAALHRQGSYRPCVYLMAWLRDDLLAWAQAYREGGAAQSSVPVVR